VAQAVSGIMRNRTESRPLPYTSRQPGEARHVRRVGHGLTIKADRPRDWMGLNSRSR
jgi:hypothetical protein